MKLEDRALLSYFREIEKFDDNGNVCMVRHVESHEFFMRKIRPASLESIYLYLQNNPSHGLPHIRHIIRNEDSIVIIEEFINGMTLSNYMSKHGLLSEETACSIIQKLCLILEHLHNAEPPIIHRDIKPSNIIIDESLNVTLIDFDTSKNYEKGKSRDTVLMGTADFAAPEQFGFGQSDARTDVYALGVLLNVLLTGKTPSEQKYSGRVSRIIKKCTELSPKKRYSTVNALSRNLNTSKAFFAPPGFRSRKPWKIITAVCGYALIFCLCSWMEFDAGLPAWWMTSIKAAALLLMLGIVALAFDYADLCSHLPAARSKNPAISWLGRILWYAVFAFTVLLVLTIISPI